MFFEKPKSTNRISLVFIEWTIITKRYLRCRYQISRFTDFTMFIDFLSISSNLRDKHLDQTRDNQIVHTKSVYLSSGCASTALWPIKFISPVIILPHRVYEYRMTHNGGYTGVYRSGAMKSEVKFDEGVIIQIHKNPTNGERSGLTRTK